MPGHGGAGKSLRDKLPKGLPDDIEFNPGGLAVVWAKKNNRMKSFNPFLTKKHMQHQVQGILCDFLLAKIYHLILVMSKMLLSKDIKMAYQWVAH
ncbi:MAG: hypothetical protein CM15mP127_07980 [Gammaproteobacteria bacterium]|nr:MAG: hypothetical protein CM15mP127_07980 [Gammaproteobacteria bacterium]